MVFNNTRVIPARLFGLRGEAKIELLLHKPVDQQWLAFAKPAKKLRVGDTIIIADDFAAEVIEKREDGQVLLRFSLEGEAFLEALHRHGHMPLPPYIKRADTAEDRERYQTIYAKHDGSVAAPTAGLHYTPALLAALESAGMGRAEVTLHVGAGTFQPVKVSDTRDHVMHHEWGCITPEVAATINATKARGGRVVAVGTTAMRLLEAATNEDGVLMPFVGETDIFITPGYRFRLVDALLTNFHLPKSTLFMLVSAFSGLEVMQTAYAHAIAQGYRFYSYGDGCLLEKKIP